MQVSFALRAADLEVERQRVLIGLAGGVVIGATKRDISEALDAVGFAQHRAAGRLLGLLK